MAKPAFSAHSLENLLDRNFPARGPLWQLAEGQESRAFAFDAADEQFVVRVNRQVQGFEVDRLVHAVLPGSGIAVPEVTAILPLDDQWVCVSRRCPGETLQSLPADGAYAYGPAVARTLDQLAAVDAVLLERLGASPLFGSLGCWPDFVRAVVELEWRGVSPGLARQIHQWTDLIVQHVPGLPPVLGLVHGDFGSNNVLVQDGTISAVLDWSEARIGDPQYDVANILFWRSWLPCMEQQARYFEAEEPGVLRDQARLRCYQLRIGLAVLNDALADGDAHLAEWAAGRLADTTAER